MTASQGRSLRAYPNNPAARKVIKPQAKGSQFFGWDLRAYPKNWYTYRMSTEPTPKRTRTRTPNNTTTTGFRISDERWAVLEPPLLSRSMNAHRFGGGRPRGSDRRNKRGEE